MQKLHSYAMRELGSEGSSHAGFGSRISGWSPPVATSGSQCNASRPLQDSFPANIAPGSVLEFMGKGKEAGTYFAKAI